MKATAFLGETTGRGKIGKPQEGFLKRGKLGRTRKARTRYTGTGKKRPKEV